MHYYEGTHSNGIVCIIEYKLKRVLKMRVPCCQLLWNYSLTRVHMQRSNKYWTKNNASIVSESPFDWYCSRSGSNFNRTTDWTYILESYIIERDYRSFGYDFWFMKILSVRYLKPFFWNSAQFFYIYLEHWKRFWKGNIKTAFFYKQKKWDKMFPAREARWSRSVRNVGRLRSVISKNSRYLATPDQETHQK